ncbi:MAG: hypothetical protein H6738_01910 [Alphaproteobacteria bacterium]|nr:hypothetical protein [Alphaproteobacteria bacterium]MCB9695524.1 hypothetical protein [Alphaproteobacteria bacterium]
MASVAKKIGLSLGADICWPASYEEIMKRLDLDLPVGADRVRFQTERVTVEPFDLAYEPSYDLVIDRVTHWFHTSREWVKKLSLDGVYVLNNPWAIQSMEKHTSYVAMMKLGLPIPKTWMIPPKEYETGGDWDVTVRRYNRLFDLGKVGEEIGYPAFLKPYDGGGWVGVTRVTDERSLRQAYDRSGKRVQHLQAAVKDYDLFIRAIGMGPQVNVVKYDADQPLHDRYRVEFGFVNGEEHRRATRICRTINAFFGWDFNSCEMLRAGGVLYPIDFANACPDSQVTSLHFHFPWLVKSMLRWTIFNAATGRKKPMTLWWDRFFAAHDPELDLDTQLERYDAIAREYFDSDRFEAFDAEHLGHLDEVALEFFGSDRFYDIVQEKVEALFPKHEIKVFTDHFFGMVQFWRKTEMERMARASKPTE